MKKITIILLLISISTYGVITIFFNILHNTIKTETININNNKITNQNTILLYYNISNDINCLNTSSFFYKYSIGSISQLDLITVKSHLSIKRINLNNKQTQENISYFDFLYLFLEKKINSHFYKNKTINYMIIKHKLKKFTKVILPPPKIF